MHRADLQQGLLPLPVISDRPPVLWTLMFVYQGQVECSSLGWGPEEAGSSCSDLTSFQDLCFAHW